MKILKKIQEFSAFIRATPAMTEQQVEEYKYSHKMNWVNAYMYSIADGLKYALFFAFFFWIGSIFMQEFIKEFVPVMHNYCQYIK